MENFRLSHFSMIVLKAMIKQTFLQEKKIILSLLPMFTEHGVIGLFREPHANILSVATTPILPLIAMEGEDL